MPRLRISECFFGCKGGSERDGGIGKDILGDPKPKKPKTSCFSSAGPLNAVACSGLKSSALCELPVQMSSQIGFYPTL